MPVGRSDENIGTSDLVARFPKIAQLLDMTLQEAELRGEMEAMHFLMFRAAARSNWLTQELWAADPAFGDLVEREPEPW